MLQKTRPTLRRLVTLIVCMSQVAVAAAVLAAAWPPAAFADSSGAAAAGVSGADSGAASGTGSVAGGDTLGPAAGTLVAAPPQFGSVGGSLPFGSAVRLGDTNALFNSIADNSTVNGTQAPFVNITPSIGATESFATGTVGSNRRAGNSFITSINPALLIRGRSPSATYSLNYAPGIQFYSNNNSDNAISQNLAGALDVTLIPDTFTISARAYASNYATFGGQLPGGSSVLNNNDNTLSQSYSITPSYQKRFLSAGTLNLYYSAQYSRQTGEEAFLPGSSQPFFAPNEVFSQTEGGSFTTVPFFTRFHDKPEFSMSEDIGSGVLNAAHQYFYQNTLGYALIRHVYLTAAGGYENIFYAGVPETNIDDPTWSFGVRMMFPHAGLLVLRYQHLYGFNAPYMQLTYPVTTRTMLTASYFEVLETQLQGLSAGVASAGFNALGAPVSGLTSQPALLDNQSLGIQNGLTRTKQFTAALTTTFPHDTISLSGIWERDTLVANAPGFAGFSQSSYSATLTESHSFSERLTGLVYLDYGRATSPTLGNGDSSTSIYGVSAALTYRFSPTLTGTLQDSVTNEGFGSFGGFEGSNPQLQNIITAGIQKSF